MNIDHSSLPSILLQQNLLTEEELKGAREKARKMGRTLEEVLREEGLVTMELLERAVAEHYRVPVFTQRPLIQRRRFPRILRAVTECIIGTEETRALIGRIDEWTMKRERAKQTREALRCARMHDFEAQVRHRSMAILQKEKRMTKQRESAAAKRARRSAERWETARIFVNCRFAAWDKRMLTIEKKWQEHRKKREEEHQRKNEEEKRKEEETRRKVEEARAREKAAKEAIRAEKEAAKRKGGERRKQFFANMKKPFAVYREMRLREKEERRKRRKERHIAEEKAKHEKAEREAAERAKKAEDRRRKHEKRWSQRDSLEEKRAKEEEQKQERGGRLQELSLAEDARREAMRQILIEQEKRRLTMERGGEAPTEAPQPQKEEVGEKEHELERRIRELEEKEHMPREQQRTVQQLSVPISTVVVHEAGPVVPGGTSVTFPSITSLQTPTGQAPAKPERPRTKRQKVPFVFPAAVPIPLEPTAAEDGGGEAETTGGAAGALSPAIHVSVEKRTTGEQAKGAERGKEKGKGKQEGGGVIEEEGINIGEILTAQNYISEEEFKEAEKKAKNRHIPIEIVLKEEGLVTRELLQNAVAEYYGMPFIDLRSQPPEPAVVELLPEQFAVSNNAIAALRKEDGTLVVATSSPERAGELTKEIKRILPSVPEVAPAYAARESIEAALAFYRKPLATRFQTIIEKHKKVAPEIIEEIFSDAVQLGASDIHFEPQEKVIVVRFRVDGVMHEAGRIPKEYYEGVVNRIKIAGNMRIDEHFAAQDGAIRWKSGLRYMDVRVSIVPVVDGEKIVMRLLSEYVRTLTLNDLGFSERHTDTLFKAAHKPFGMILTTGPTGSGKSTTLYGLLKIRNTPDVNISTIEDPVEYKVPGINHIQVNTKAGLTFDKGLRAIVRQDPDIILVGEIRDNITAQISVNAALTGHLLFSTLHANDAATAVPRLLEMEIEPYLLASTMELIVAQRLMRRICMRCRYSRTVSYSDACNLFSGAKNYFSNKDKSITLYHGKGCEACGNTGYKGRIGVYELLEVTPEIEDLVVQRRTTAEINDLAREQGMLTLFEDGLQKVAAGLSTIDELLRVASPPDFTEE